MIRPGLRVDLLLITGGKKIDIPKLAAVFRVKQLVLDGSVPAWRSKGYKKVCDSLRIPLFDVKEKGAFVMSCR
jgi:hypothetical protein